MGHDQVLFFFLKLGTFNVKFLASIIVLNNAQVAFSKYDFL